ncbi:acetyltransferase [Vibrio breoganii]
MLGVQTKLPLIVIGGGGHASVLVDILRKQRREILAVVSPDDIYCRGVFSNLLHLEKDSDVLKYRPQDIRLVNGIGMVPKSSLRQSINEFFLDAGYEFETVISDDAYVSPYASVQLGAQVFPHAILQPGVVVGEHSIINTGALIEHDCDIGTYSHIAPRATLCGEVSVASEAFIGAGATVLPSLKISQNAVIGASCHITEDVKAGCTVYPARTITK